MPKHNRSIEAAIWLTLGLVVAILLGARFGWAGLFVGVVVAGVAFVGFRRDTVDPEVEALKASLRVARDDIRQVIDEYDELLTGSSIEAIADRTLNYPALAEGRTEEPAIEDFMLRLGSSKRFVARVDTHLSSSSVDRHSLERLLNIADQRAYDLAESWAEARRAARRLGPAG